MLPVEMVPLGNYWSVECDEPSAREGWGLFITDGVFSLQKIDVPEDDFLGDYPLTSDKQAYEWVLSGAVKGNRRHSLALYLDGKSAEGEILVPLPYIEYQGNWDGRHKKAN